MRKADNLPLSCAVVTKSGKLTSWNPLGLSRPVMGLLYLLYIYVCVCVCVYKTDGGIEPKTQYMAFETLRLVKTMTTSNKTQKLLIEFTLETSTQD